MVVSTTTVNFASADQSSDDLLCPGTGIPSNLALLRQLYRVAVDIPSEADTSATVRLWGGNNFFKIAFFLSGE